MANVDFPRGFGLLDGEHYLMKMYQVDGSTATTLAPGDIADGEADGYVVRAAADAGVSVVGVVVSTYDSNKAVLRYLPASTAGYALVACATDSAVFTAQDDAAATLDQGVIGATTDHVDGAANTFTGRSIQEINATTGGAQMRIIGKVEDPNNALGANCMWKVVFTESQFMSTTSI